LWTDELEKEAARRADATPAPVGAERETGVPNFHSTSAASSI
jgi:hypothetical protein